MAYFVRIRRKCASPKTTRWSTHSRRIDPISLSAKPFCQGEPGAIGLSRMPMAPASISHFTHTRPVRIFLLDEVQLARATHKPANVLAANVAGAHLKPPRYPFFIGFRQIEPRFETALQQQLHAKPEHLLHHLDVVADLEELLGLPRRELLNIPQPSDRAQEVELPVREFRRGQR